MEDAAGEAVGAAGLFGSMMTAAETVEVEVEAVFFFSACSVAFLLVAGPIVQQQNAGIQPGRRQRL